MVLKQTQQNSGQPKTDMGCTVTRQRSEDRTQNKGEITSVNKTHLVMWAGPDQRMAGAKNNTGYQEK